VGCGFKDIPFDEIPIDSVTNGIHIKSHISNEMYELLYRYLGERFNTHSSSSPKRGKKLMRYRMKNCGEHMKEEEKD
jgi:glucan phosphorylase